MAYEAISNENLTIVPIGVNYSDAAKLRSDVFYNIGEPILVKDFFADYQKNPAKANKDLIGMLEPKMKALITHIESPENDEIVKQVETLCKKKLLQDLKLDCSNLEHDFNVLKLLTEKINQAAIEQKQTLETLKEKSSSYFSKLKALKLSDWTIEKYGHNKVPFFVLFYRSLFLLAGFPIYALGLIGNYIPFTATGKITKKIIKNIEFYSSFWIGIAMIVFLLNYILWFSLLVAIFPSILMPSLTLLLFGLSAWFSLYYHSYLDTTLSLFKYNSKKTAITELHEDRTALLTIINKLGEQEKAT